MNRIPTFGVSLALMAVLTFADGAVAENEDLPAGDAALVERIVELRRQLAELEAGLTREAREELERRLAEAANGVVPPADPPPTLAEPEPEAEAVVAAEDPSPAARAGARCPALAFFDTDGDGQFGATDRYWRHFSLWSDDNSNGAIEAAEVASTFDFRILAIALDGRSFTARKGKDEESGEIESRGGRALLDVRRDGFGRGDAVLVVDTARLGRGDGPRLLDDGVALEGWQAWRRGLEVRAAGVGALTASCP